MARTAFNEKSKSLIQNVTISRMKIMIGNSTA